MSEILNQDGQPATPPTREQRIAQIAESAYNAIRQGISEKMPNLNIEDIYCIMGCLQEQLYVSINQGRQ